ncbi:SH2 domain-containing protein 3C [Halotydeus destructor]|nr:SH2 domain-containing protein 3C [Halotydeus destructor]
MASECLSEEEQNILKRELSLDRNDLRSHAWFHGNISRQSTEELLVNDGDFIVRESASRPGDYVLSSKWKTTSMHFVICKVIMQPDTSYERIQYTFEGDYFDTIPDLITYYVGHKRPISSHSGAIVIEPVNRRKPLTPLAQQQALNNLLSRSVAMSRSSMRRSFSRSGRVTPLERQPSFAEVDSVGPARLRSSILSLGSISLSSEPGQSKFGNDTEYEAVYNHPVVVNHSGISYDSAFSSNCSETDSPRVSLSGSKRDSGTELEDQNYEFPRSRPPNISVGQEYDTPKSYVPRPLPPQPSRPPSRADSEQLDYDTPRAAVCCSRTSSRMSSPVLEPRRDRKFSSKGPVRMMDIPKNSVINAQEFFSFLIASENKPLDQASLTKVHSVLKSTSARLLALHLTHVDLEFFGHQSDSRSMLEFISLPQATRVRKDILERAQCLKNFVSISILTLSDVTERAEVVSKWIKVAFELKAALGNLQGFSCIIEGLTIGPIARLDKTWSLMRCNYTQEAVSFESNLRPALSAMRARKHPEAPNTCLPHVTAIVETLSEHESFGGESNETATYRDGRSQELLDKIKADVGLEQLRTYIQIASCLASSVPMLKRKARTIFDGTVYEHLLLDMFSTEFHRRLLWGFKGSVLESPERFYKLDKVLDLMSYKCEQPAGMSDQ